MTYFSPAYRGVMSRSLPASVFKDDDYYRRLAHARAQAIANIVAGQWFKDPIVSVFHDEIFNKGPCVKTQAALSRNPSGEKRYLTQVEFAKIFSSLVSRSQQPLKFKASLVDRLNTLVSDFAQTQLTAEHAGQVLADLAVDFEADKVAELEERNETWVRNRDFNALTQQHLESGALAFNVTQAGVMVCPVVNFSALLDVQQKVMHPLQLGVPVTWLVRDEVAAQQGTREVMLLQASLAEAGLGEYLNILVLTQAQRAKLFDALGLTTLMTGRSSTAINIQQQVPDASTSGSGIPIANEFSGLLQRSPDPVTYYL